MTCNNNHRHIFFLILVFSLSGTHLTYAQKFAVGIKAGATLSKGSFGDKDDNDDFTNSWAPGYFGAGLINLRLKNSFSFQTEAGYSIRGRKIEFNEDTWHNVANYHFLDASMLLRKSYPLKWSRNAKGNWFFNVGPKISYWLNGKGAVATGGTYVDPVDGLTKISTADSYDYRVKFEKEPEEPDAPDFDTMYLSDVNRWLFGLDVGIGVNAPTKALQRFIVELRYTTGQTFYGGKNGAFNRTLGFKDNLRANEKIFSLSIDYTINRVYKEGQKGKSTKKDVKKSKPRKNIDSMIK